MAWLPLNGDQWTRLTGWTVPQRPPPLVPASWAPWVLRVPVLGPALVWRRLPSLVGLTSALTCVGNAALAASLGWAALRGSCWAPSDHGLVRLWSLVQGAWSGSA